MLKPHLSRTFFVQGLKIIASIGILLLAQILKNNMTHARNICTFIELHSAPFRLHTFSYLFFTSVQKCAIYIIQQYLLTKKCGQFVAIFSISFYKFFYHGRKKNCFPSGMYLSFPYHYLFKNFNRAFQIFIIKLNEML